MADVDDQTLASTPTRLPATTPNVEAGRSFFEAGRSFFFSPSNTSVTVDDCQELSYKFEKLCFPIPFEKNKNVVTIVGAYSGIVLLHIHVNKHSTSDRADRFSSIVRATRFSCIVKYNPSTGASRKIHDPKSSSCSVYGFGDAKTPQDLKFVRFRKESKGKYCDVLSLKTSTWSTFEITLPDSMFYEITNVGTFLNGFLYWFASTHIVALSVEDLVVSEIDLPNPHSYMNTHLGTLHGQLCMITDTNNAHDSGHDLWVLNEWGAEKSWSKDCSFTVGLKSRQITYHEYRILNIMDDGSVLMVDTSGNIIICNTSKSSYKKLYKSARCAIDFRTVSGIEYQKSQVSP